MDSARNPTLQTIADAAGVSRVTVSRALRNDPSISATTRERIHRIAVESGYRPNPLVSSLMTQVRARKVTSPTVTIAHVTTTYPPGDWRTFFFTRECIEGAMARAGKLGFQIEEFCIKEPGMTGKRMTQILKARGIRGVLIGKQLHEVTHVTLDWQQFTAVALGYSMRRPALHRVCADCMHAVTIAVRQLHRLGYRRIGMATFARLDLRNDHGWLASFLAHQHMADRADQVPPLIAPEYDEARFFRWFRKHRPQVVLAGSSHILNWLREDGWRVPEDVGVVLLGRFEKIDDCAHVDFRAGVIGAKAAELIIAQLHRNETGVPADPMTVLVQGAWVAGNTVRKVRR